MIGKTLAHYQILEKLGTGSMGVVYRAKDSKLGRQVAIKVLPDELLSDKERLARFRREARAAAALNHPNVVTLYDTGQQGSTMYIAMEFVEGKTLRQMLSAGRLPVYQVLDLFAQMAAGLAKAHAEGIVHRDLKPENVMVTKDGLAKIMDFGLAKLLQGQADLSVTDSFKSQLGMRMGTPKYMSPEQIKGPPVDFRSDQFSFGSILYEMATGRPAFLGDTIGDTWAAILRDEPEPILRLRPDFPAGFRVIVERCLAKNPEGRFDTTRQLAKNLDHLRLAYVVEQLRPQRPGEAESMK